MMRKTTRNSDVATALRACRPAFLATVAFSLAINLLMFTGPLYMIEVYDRVLLSRHTGTLLALSGLALAAFALYGALELIRSRILIRSGTIFDRALARPLIERVLSRSTASTEAQGAQSLRDLDQLRDFLAGSAPVVFCDAPWTPLFVGLAWLMHSWLGLAALAGIGGLLVLTLATEWATRPALNAATASASAAAQISATAMRNRDVVAALGMAGRFADRWSGKHEAVIALQTRASDRAALIVSLSRTYRLILQSGMLGLGAWLAIHQEITVGSMFAANLLIGRALQPVEQVVQHWKGFIVAREAYARLTAVLAAGEGPAQRMDLPAPTGHVSVEQLAVCAPHAAKPALAGVSFRLAAGEMMTVVGASGAGKSTLIKALVNVWSPTAGAIRLDGATLAQYAPERLGSAIGYLPQEVELLAGTIGENIARFGETDAEKVVAAARMAGVHDLILRLPNGYDTEVGPGGSVLSGGQRQRIGLARALYDKPALIVLDEPNASLDLSGEAALAEALEAVRAGGATVIVSTHKPALVSMADKLLVIADGTQQMFGPRAEVLERIAPRPLRVA